jgi:hypothetical protein
LSLAKPALEEAGIAFVVDREDPENLPGFFGASGIGTILSKCFCRIQVAPESEAEARALLEPLRGCSPER